MNITITAENFTNSYDMAKDRVKYLLDEAFRMTTDPNADPKSVTVQASAEDAPVKPALTRQSCLNSLYGSNRRETLPSDNNHMAKPKTASQLSYKASDEFYKGFLLIRCEQCGKIKAYCAKQYKHYHKCSCGHETEFHVLKPANLACKCGKVFHYRTNFTEDTFTQNCLHCGQPVDLEYNPRHDCYDSVGGYYARA